MPTSRPGCLKHNLFLSKRDEVIVRVSVVLRRTVFSDADRRFYKLCGSHLQRQVIRFVLVNCQLIGPSQECFNPDDLTSKVLKKFLS